MAGAERGTHLQHVPALDGLRGIAVAAVVAFHVGWLRGGWLGVDLFFVLSGYLISRLLFVEHAARGRIDLRHFWSRRARRLLPALLCVIAVVAIAERVRGRLTGPTGGRWDVVGALTYTSNWVRLRGGAGYWSQFGPPSLLEHFWSLAIEEQFYLAWPLIMLGLTRLRRSTATLVLLIATIAGAAWALVLFNRTLDASRVYMGTDSRAVALLAGATIASLAEWRSHWLRAFTWLAPAGLVTLLFAMATMRGTKLFTYRGGLLGCTLAATVLVAGVAAGGGWLGRLLAMKPLRWLGNRSYGIYLWHWPILVGIGVAGHSQKPAARIVLGVVASLLVAEASYRFVEMPIRRRGLTLFRWRPTTPLLGLGLTAAAIVAIALPVLAPKRVIAAALPPSTTAPSTVASTTTSTTAASVVSSASTTTSTTAAPTTTTSGVTRPVGRAARVLVLGDSVGLFLGERMIVDQAALGVEAHNASIAGCPPSYAPLKRRSGADSVPLVFDPGCAEWVNGYPALVADIHPDVSYVVFGASLLDQNEIAPGVWSRPCEAAFDGWYRDTLTKMSAELSADGGSVVLVSQAYYRSEVSDRTGDNDRQIDCENRVAAAVAKESAGKILIADLGRWACPTNACLPERDGIKLRPDGTHFKDDAAALANNWLLQQTFG